jgi:DNA repair protein RadC
MEIHEGHRARMKQRFLNYGLSNFDDHNVLELLLFYALPRKDINPIAHALLKRFGSLKEVLEASVEELMEVPFMGENSAILFKIIPQICRRYMTEKSLSNGILDSSAKSASY